jgi:hypothetical protein
MSLIVSMLPLLALSFSADPAPSVVSGASSSTEDQKIVCKKTGNTGTRFAKKTCRTRAEWDAIREQAMRDAAEAINRPQINPKSE